MSDDPLLESDLILYQTEDGRTRIQCRFEKEAVWLSAVASAPAGVAALEAKREAIR